MKNLNGENVVLTDEKMEAICSLIDNDTHRECEDAETNEEYLKKVVELHPDFEEVLKTEFNLVF